MSVLRIRWPKYWSFSFSISPSNDYPRLISFKIDWFDLLAVQGILKNLLQHHNLKSSVLQLSAFFMVQLSHPYITTGKTMALTIGKKIPKVPRDIWGRKFIPYPRLSPHQPPWEQSAPFHMCPSWTSLRVSARPREHAHVPPLACHTHTCRTIPHRPQSLR